MSSSTVQPNNVQPTIFREYIGAESFPVLTDFPHIINTHVTEFHFILAFATEVYDGTTKMGTGTFNLTSRLETFTADIIRNLKDRHQKAKVVISIGGRGFQYPFNITPAQRDIWLGNAKRSLKSIIDGFRDSRGNILIDGIDVNYEKIKANENDFVESIGELIRSLRTSSYVNVVSIAPSESVRPQYKTLFQKYGQFINWVDYQFYDQRLPNHDAFVNLYHELLSDYPNEKLLAGFSSDPSDAGNISREDFFAGCGRLLKDKSLPGIFVWNDPFKVENDAQELLVHFKRIAT